MSTEAQRESKRRYREKFPERVQASRDAWVDKNPGYEKRKLSNLKQRDPEKYHTRHFKNRYGITAEQYRQMVERQSGLCAICGGPPTRNGRLYVDHDHKTGRVRGLLCWEDNLVLGQVKEDAERLRRAAEYLERR